MTESTAHTKEESRPSKTAEPLRRVMLMARDIAPHQKPFWRLNPNDEQNAQTSNG